MWGPGARRVRWRQHPADGQSGAAIQQAHAQPGHVIPLGGGIHAQDAPIRGPPGPHHPQQVGARRPRANHRGRARHGRIGSLLGGLSPPGVPLRGQRGWADDPSCGQGLDDRRASGIPGQDGTQRAGAGAWGGADGSQP
ncbi:MAG: hypothetical protein MI924_38450 [Chloroflexales bacterium]|nr:hypothetical protein [Chloroflexales bacterium]